MPRLAAGCEGLDDDHAPAAARTSVPRAVFVRIFAVAGGRRRVGHAEQAAGQCDITGPVAVALEVTRGLVDPPRRKGVFDCETVSYHTLAIYPVETTAKSSVSTNIAR